MTISTITYCIRLITQLLLFLIFKIIFSKPADRLPLSDKVKNRYIIAANHASGLDPFAIVAALKLRDFWHLAPFAFMTANVFYAPLWLRPFSWAAGCFPAYPLNENYKNYGVPGAIKLIDQGYSLVIFPEGKRVKEGRLPAKPGLTKILKARPDLKIILAKIEWQKPSLKRLAFKVETGKNAQVLLDKIYKL